MHGDSGKMVPFCYPLLERFIWGGTKLNGRITLLTWLHQFGRLSVRFLAALVVLLQSHNFFQREQCMVGLSQPWYQLAGFSAYGRLVPTEGVFLRGIR